MAAVGCASLLLVGVGCAACGFGSAAIPFGFRGWAAAREHRPAAEAAPAGGRFVDAGDVSLFLQEAGPSSGPAVLLVAGSGAWSGTWRDTSAALADAGYHVVAVDLPPFGFSDRPVDGTYDRPAQARRLIGALDALGIERAAWVGHSFGGGPTLEGALLAPDRVTALVLVDAAIGLDAGAGSVGLVDRPVVAELIVANTFQNPLVTRAAVRSMIHDPADASDDRIALYQQPFTVVGTTPAVAAWLPELLAPSAAASLDWGQVSGLTVPTLLIWGQQDTVTPPDQARALAARMPDARLAWLDGVGHIPQIEDVDAFHGALLPFLADATGHAGRRAEERTGQ